MTRRNVKGTVYLLHLVSPLRHARHYQGWAEKLPERLAAHAEGRGARLLQVCREAGIPWVLVRTWEGTRELERRLKRRHNAPQLCPVCRGAVKLAKLLTA